MEAKWRALLVLTAARTSLGFQFQSVASVSPMLVEELGLTGADLGTLIGLYFLPGLALALPGGALGRRFGDMRVVVAGLVLMALGGLVASLASGLAGLAVGRLLAGTGAVLLNVLMAKMVTDWFAGQREIVLAMAIFVNSFPIGIGLAQLSLGALAAAAGWAGAFAATAGLALLALLLLRARSWPVLLLLVPISNNIGVCSLVGRGIRRLAVWRRVYRRIGTGAPFSWCFVVAGPPTSRPRPPFSTAFFDFPIRCTIIRGVAGRPSNGLFTEFLSTGSTESSPRRFLACSIAALPCPFHHFLLLPLPYMGTCFIFIAALFQRLESVESVERKNFIPLDSFVLYFSTLFPPPFPEDGLF